MRIGRLSLYPYRDHDDKHGWDYANNNVMRFQSYFSILLVQAAAYLREKKTGVLEILWLEGIK